MDCSPHYSKLMSLKLDGALNEEDNKIVEEHVAGCPACAALWDAMLDADVLIWKWVHEPLPLPDNFGSKVMVKIAAQEDVSRAPSYTWTPQTSNVTRPLTEALPSLPGPLTSQMHGWHHQAARYVRVAAIAVVSVAASLGLALALLVSGVIRFEGPLAGLSATLRSYMAAIDTWVRSLFMGMGVGVYAAVGLVMLLLALIGWQLIAQYQRSVSDVRGNTGYLEAVA
jgi:hypothetical protein